jgi:hypothetical protein
MRRIWNDYKIWILIGLAYLGFYSFKGYKILKQIIFDLYTKFILYSHNYFLGKKKI